MADEIYYSRAPIIEAILAIEVESDSATFDSFDFDLAGYPSSEAIQQGEFTFDIKEASAKADVKPVGRRFTSSDGKQVVQFKTDGFIFSRLAPYDGWDSFSGEAKKLWDVYIGHLGTHWKIKTLIVRYINKLILPAGPNIDAYFNVYAYFPPDYVVHGRNYLLRVEILIDEPIAGILTMQHATLPELHADAFAFLVDHEFKFALSDPGVSVWDLVQSVRSVKNRTFKRVLTSRTEELIS